MIAVAYVDDILLWSRDENDTTEMMVTLGGAGRGFRIRHSLVLPPSFQSSLAERSVQTVFWVAHHIILHAALQWAANHSEDPRLWLQAVKYSEHLFNRTPSLGCVKFGGLQSMFLFRACVT